MEINVGFGGIFECVAKNRDKTNRQELHIYENSKRMKKLFYLIVLILFTFKAFSCTTAVISGKYTKDGRPLLLKHRDTWAVNNRIVIFDDGKYSCVGLVNSIDSAGKSIWIGYNSEGFAIMNSASYNLNNDTITQTGYEGRLMKEALQNCATIEDFEKFLDKRKKPYRLEANFGVIDAQGGAAYFELGNFKYVKIDANDPAVAPYGYLIRTNYSFTGEMGKGGGYIRYVTADEVFRDAVANDDLTYRTIVNGISRNLKHSLTGTDLVAEYGNLPENTEKMVFFKDFIPRSGSSSSCIVQGVKKGEDPVFTTMWTMLGFPLTTVTIPIWLTNDGILPQIVRYDDSIKDSPLCHYALELKKEVYSYRLGSHSKYYININALINGDNTGIMQRIEPVENMVLSMGEELLDGWRDNGIDIGEMKNYYNAVDDKINLFYKGFFRESIF